MLSYRYFDLRIYRHLILFTCNIDRQTGERQTDGRTYTERQAFIPIIRGVLVTIF